MNLNFIIYGLVFLAVIGIVQGIYLVAFGKAIASNTKVNRRMDMLNKSMGRDEVLAKLRKEMDQHRKARSFPVFALLADKAEKAALAFTPQHLILVMLGVSVAAFLGQTIGTGASLPVRATLAPSMGIGGVYTWLHI